MIDLEERQLLAQTVFALTRCSASPSNCRHPLTQTQIEPLYEGCIDPPAADGQDLLNRQLRTEHHAVLYLDHAPSSHGFDHLCIEQLGQRHPSRFRHRAFGLVARRLHPTAEMRHDGGEGMWVPVTQKERHTPGRQQLRDLMQHGLGHRQGAFPDLDAQEQCALGIL